MSTDLLPCPFCGKAAIAENYVVDAQVRCINPRCRAKIMRRHGPKEDNGLPEAIAAWNTRDKPK